MIQNLKQPIIKGTSGQSGVQIHQTREKINLFGEPPRQTISLHEFYQIALKRLQLLRKIEFM